MGLWLFLTFNSYLLQYIVIWRKHKSNGKEQCRRSATAYHPKYRKTSNSSYQINEITQHDCSIRLWFLPKCLLLQHGNSDSFCLRQLSSHSQISVSCSNTQLCLCFRSFWQCRINRSGKKRWHNIIGCSWMGLLDVYVWRYSHRSCHKGRRSSAQMIEIIIINLKI